MIHFTFQNIPSWEPLSVDSQWPSLHNRGATLIRINSTQLRIPIHTAYVAPKLAYANSSTTIPPRLGPVLRHPEVQYTTPIRDSNPRGYMLLPPSLHSQCAVVGPNQGFLGARAFRSMWIVTSLDQQAPIRMVPTFFRQRQAPRDSNPRVQVLSVFQPCPGRCQLLSPGLQHDGTVRKDNLSFPLTRYGSDT